VKVLCSEGVATHTGPEPCVVVCKDGDEASVGERIGQPLSRERNLIPGVGTSTLAGPSVPTVIMRGSGTALASTPLAGSQIEVIDGDTVSVGGRQYRRVGLDTPEAGLNA
jgi:endonuclease YncB( thermonuclease family)